MAWLQASKRPAANYLGNAFGVHGSLGVLVEVNRQRHLLLAVEDMAALRP